MSIGSISNSPATQQSLTALTNTAQLLQQTQQQLSTGQAVNSPSDNPAEYYAAQTFMQQANDLSNLKDNLSTALTTVNSATDSLSSVGQVVQQLQGITAEAAGTTDTAVRNGLASQYNALLPQLDEMVDDASFNGTNLLNNTSNNLQVYFNASNTSSLTIQGVNVTSGGLGIQPASNGFATDADINAANSQLQTAQSTLDTDAANFGGNATLLQTNQDFTSSMINNLQNASDNLTVADTNQEAASLLALQAQNQLGIVSLGISGQLKNAVLNLF